jgi:hypothetical protein
MRKAAASLCPFLDVAAEQRDECVADVDDAPKDNLRSVSR